MILHITTRAAWDAALAAGVYAPASLATEGFIHCSTAAQVVATANAFFAGQADLVLLCIAEARVADTLRHEPPASAADPRAAERFPHLHGPLPVTAVTAVLPLPCGADGRFALPAGLAP